jgi:hypothetical protein
MRVLAFLADSSYDEAIDPNGKCLSIARWFCVPLAVHYPAQPSDLARR